MKLYKEEDYILTLIKLIKIDNWKENISLDTSHLCPINQLYTFSYLATRFKITEFKNLN